ncbi:NACHT, LRR and PYD domains-containing protein 12-like isoform X2 [Alosa alosa]|nr:NACHT, LRR and PYD domains-containing protein 12-like isoform X2 [Alosa alosa]XP_048121111.1 NACHT, LRR and PYD domains-containing protein 12-like isoform X2 [Alosa alosa]
MEETSSTPNRKSDECVGPGKNFAGRDSSAVQKEEDGSKRGSHSPTLTAKSEECMGQAKTFTGGDSSAGHVQQGASGTQSKRTDKTRQEKDSASEHRWTPEEAEIHEKLRSTLKSKFQQLVEGVPNQGDPRLLQEIYTDLYVTEGGGGGGVSYEHEVRQIERASWRREAQDRPIKCSDIFNRLLEEERRRKEHFLEEERRISEPFHRQHKHLRTVLTKGVAGIGKTVSVQKFILDWAEGTANQDVHFIFPLPFRELNSMKEEKLSLVDLIQHFFPEIKDSRIFSSSENRVMFIFDGLDECRLPLDFLSNPRCCDVTEPASVDVLLTNLIEGNLLPSALLWITTRPAAANQIPSKCVDQVTEIRGFNDQQKEEYFRKRISDENLASRTVTHLKSSRSLYIMCHIPVFCWITATVVERTSESENVKMPRTLTQMYTHFLIVQTSIKQKYTKRKETDEEVIFKLGKLAFQQLEKGNLIFYEEDLRECGIDVTEASVYSGVCTQIFREEAGLYQGRVFSFVHLSIQEFLAALYVFLCFSNRQRNMPDQQQTSQLSALFRAATLHDLHKTAVDLALQSKNGHLDLFLRFLLGLSLESNQNLLKHLLPQSSSQSDSSEKTAQYVKQKIRDQRSSDRDEDEDDSNRDEDVYNSNRDEDVYNSNRDEDVYNSNRDEDVYNSNRRINLFYCLNELNHHAVVEHKMSTDNLHVEMLLPGQWETKKFQFKMSEEQLAEFDLQKYIKTPEEDQTELLSPEEVLQKVLPGVTSALLQNCKLTEKSCSYLASALTSLSSRLRLLDLSGNDLHDSGVELLCSALSHQNCKLEELRLQHCILTEKSCSYLASALTSLSSRLRLLDLSGNDLHDSGVELLCSALSYQNCKLEELRLQNCKLTEKSCSYLASALTSLSSRLRLLDLSWNYYLWDSGVELLCSALSHQNCKLEELQLQHCIQTEKSCSYLASALTSLSSRLRLLDLRNNMFGFENKLSDSAVEELSALVKDPHCKLEELKVNRCTFRKESPAAAAASTSSSHSDAAELHLRDKAQQDPGAQLLSLDTHKEEHHSDAPQRSCESCAEVPDSSHWVLMKPEVSTEKSVSTYSLSSPAGSYECPKSGLRWTCAGPVTLQYCFMDWHAFAEELAHMQSRPAGPLMDIMLMSGELEEIHLPHFLCLGGCEAPVRDAVRVLHGRDSGVCVEECELTRHHARLLHPNLSPLGVIYNLFKSLLSPMRVHSEVLVYQSSTMPVFRTYLLPEDAHLKQLVERDEEKLGGVWRSKPQPVRALQMDGFYSLRTDSSSEIYPEELMLRYSATTPNFFEVYEAAASFHMELFSSADSRGQCVESKVSVQ